MSRSCVCVVFVSVCVACERVVWCGVTVDRPLVTPHLAGLSMVQTVREA